MIRFVYLHWGCCQSGTVDSSSTACPTELALLWNKLVDTSGLDSVASDRRDLPIINESIYVFISSKYFIAIVIQMLQVK